MKRRAASKRALKKQPVNHTRKTQQHSSEEAIIVKEKKEENGRITVMYVKPAISPCAIRRIINEDTDVYDATTHALLLRFRKALIDKDVCDNFYDATIELARKKTANRWEFNGVKESKKNTYVTTNIFGFMDGWAPSQKRVFKEAHVPIIQPDIRMTHFNMNTPDKYEKTLPLLHTVNRVYKRLVPTCFAKQNAKAVQIRGFTIDDTAFTTVTLNLNHASRLHTDKGDDEEGFGNLTVVEHGPPYKGGETCFPRYGLGVNVRTGDILFMNVHEPHCNSPIEYSAPDAERLSVVCYLRKQIWIKGKTMNVRGRALHNEKVRKRFLVK